MTDIKPKQGYEPLYHSIQLYKLLKTTKIQIVERSKMLKMF